MRAYLIAVGAWLLGCSAAPQGYEQSAAWSAPESPGGAPNAGPATVAVAVAMAGGGMSSGGTGGGAVTTGGTSSGGMATGAGGAARSSKSCSAGVAGVGGVGGVGGSAGVAASAGGVGGAVTTCTDTGAGGAYGSCSSTTIRACKTPDNFLPIYSYETPTKSFPCTPAGDCKAAYALFMQECFGSVGAGGSGGAPSCSETDICCPATAAKVLAGSCDPNSGNDATHQYGCYNPCATADPAALEAKCRADSVPFCVWDSKVFCWKCMR